MHVRAEGMPGGLQRWTRSEVGGLDPSTFVSPQLVRFPSFDGLQISAFVYRPVVPAADGRKLPVLIHPHGGPESQHRPSFAPIYQFLVVEQGIVVIDPNVRGSSMSDEAKTKECCKDQKKKIYSSLLTFASFFLSLFSPFSLAAGYGKTFVSLDNAEKREDSVKDLGALLGWSAVPLPWVVWC